MAPFGEGTVLLEARGPVAVITLNRPARLNAFNVQMIRDLTAAVAAVASDANVKALVITGSGRGFSAGADLAPEIVETDPKFGSVGAAVNFNMHSRWNPMMEAIYELRKPVVVAINGIAAGGGIGLALAGDVIVASPQASFVFTFASKLGIIPDLGATFHMPRSVSRGVALPLALLGDKFSADDAKRRGLIGDVHEEVLGEAMVIASRLAKVSPEAVYQTRKAFDASHANSYASQLQVERKAQEICFDSPDSPYMKLIRSGTYAARKKKTKEGPRAKL